MKLSEFKHNLEQGNNYFFQDQNNDLKVKNLEMILDVVKKINSTLILDDVLMLVLVQAIKISESQRGFIVLKNSRGDLEYKLGLDANGITMQESSFNISTTVVEDVFSSGKSIFIEGAQSDTNFVPSKSILRLALQTILCSPLIIDDKKLGVIYVDSTQLHKINIREITSTFEILAGQAAIAIRNAQLYKELNKAKELAETSSRLKTEFLAQMSHEIRTPINSILSFSSLIQEELEGEMDDELSSGFKVINRAGKRIIRTIDLILNMSELRTGSYEYIPVKTDLLRNIISPIINELKFQAEEKSISLSVECNVKNPEVFADIYTLTQIFRNLIDNAVKYTKKGKVSVKVYKDKSKKLIAEVIDTGIGISNDYIPHLFEPFSQEEQGYCREFEGNGLGLALVKKYCELNNAVIGVESEKGEGTTFTITFLNS